MNEENNTKVVEEQVSEEPKEKEEAENSPEDLIEKLNEEITSLKDQRLRAIAELENFRKRAEKDQADALKYGYEVQHQLRDEDPTYKPERIEGPWE